MRMFDKLLIVLVVIGTIVLLSSCSKDANATYNLEYLDITNITVTIQGTETVNINSENEELSVLNTRINELIQSYDFTASIVDDGKCDGGGDTIITLIDSKSSTYQLKTICVSDQDEHDLITVIYSDDGAIGYSDGMLFSQIEDLLN